MSRYARARARKLAAPASFGYEQLPPLESTLAGQITNALQIGATVSSTQQKRASKQTPGLPDLYAAHGAWGIRCWVEVKQPGERPSKVQREWHQAERAAGGVVLVVTSPEDAVRQFCALPRRRESG